MRRPRSGRKELEALVDQLRREHGWAHHVTGEQLLRTWPLFVEEVEQGYTDMPEEYWNDAAGREILDVILSEAPPALAAKLRQELAPWDERFLASTVDPPVIDHNFTRRWERRIPRILAGDMLRLYEQIGGPIPPEVEQRR